jgi:hypothetical protein
VLNEQQFGATPLYHGTNARLKPGDKINPSVANSSDYQEDDNGDMAPYPHSYFTPRPQTARRYGNRIYEVAEPAKHYPDWSMHPYAQAHKTPEPLTVKKRSPYVPPMQHFDAGSLQSPQAYGRESGDY